MMKEYWYDYAKPKHRDKTKLCYTETSSFIFHGNSEDVYEDLEGDVQ